MLGVWLESTIVALTQVEGVKRLIVRAVVWGLLLLGVLAWTFRHAVARLLPRLSTWLERGNAEQLPARVEAGLLEHVLSAAFTTLAVALTFFALLDAPAFTIAFREDGPFEYASAALYGLAALFCVRHAFRAHGWPRLRFWLVGLALLFIFVGGEEISWGQRLFDIGTPDGLAAINVQGELTLHNVYSNSLFVYPGLAVTAALLCILPLLHAYSPNVRRILDALQFPVASLACAALYGFAVLCYAIVGLMLGTPTPLPINWSDHLPHYDDEMLELLISALFAIQSIVSWRLRVGEAESEISRVGERRLSAR